MYELKWTPQQVRYIYFILLKLKQAVQNKIGALFASFKYDAISLYINIFYKPGLMHI